MAESELFYEISSLATERRNEKTENIDTASISEILHLINDEDLLVAEAVKKEIPNIEIAVENIVKAFRKGGRLIYVGAGTSGRLGILDASECPPTFGTSPEMVQGIIAGGNDAVFKAVEGAEDSIEGGKEAIRNIIVNSNDVVCGLAASGRTPFVIGALRESHARSAYTILVSTAERAEIKKKKIHVDSLICPAVGPEVIAGSTRMKSGTAQKLVLNMLTTASMIRLGKTLGNVMVDLQLTNAKLNERAKNILMALTGVDYDDAVRYLSESGGSVKTALVMILGDVDARKATELLELSNGFVRMAIEEAGKK
ncbi:MAG: N-acetylmuramic acid 6-phosphate etherase [Ignavibacteria bacterium]|nr:N-acetylmuramic acid 6-phosphate etherase [Ignavibacteria bacterium]